MLLKKPRSRDYAEVIVIKLDRWARSSKELILEIQKLIDKGVRFHSLEDNIDFISSYGRLHFEILATFSEVEPSLISERTLEGLNGTKAQCKILGLPKGSKDSMARPKGGYYLKVVNKRNLMHKHTINPNYNSI